MPHSVFILKIFPKGGVPSLLRITEIQEEKIKDAIYGSLLVLDQPHPILCQPLSCQRKPMPETTKQARSRH
jgi:hypothetical protein